MDLPGAARAADAPQDEAARLLSAGAPSAALDGLTALAARLLSTPAAPVAVQVSLLTDVQTVAAGTGLGPGAVGRRSPVADSLCTVTVATGGPLVLPSTQDDVRVADLPPVLSGGVGAYLGVPLVSPGGVPVGALCAYSVDVRTWTDDDVALLEEVGAAVAAQLDLQVLSVDLETDRLRWEVAVDAAGVGSFDWDLETGRLDGDARMAALFGYPPDAFGAAGDPLARVHRQDRADVDAVLATATATCSDVRAEFRVVHPDGSTRWLSARGRALAGPDGVATRLLGTAHDVSDVRSARDEAARLLETMATGFLAVDRDWRIGYLNSAGARVVGHAAEEVLGRELWEVFPDLLGSTFGDSYERAVATGLPVEVEAYYPHLDGWFEVRAVPTADGLSLYFLDVSGRHDDQERARAATARLELLASVSAELAAAGLDVEGAVARLARIVTPDLADWCLVSLAGEDGVRDVGYWHSDPLMRPALAQYVRERLVDRADLGAVQQVTDTREPVVITSGLVEQVMPQLGSAAAKQAWLELASESVVVVPLEARGHTTGVLTLCRGRDRPPATDDEVTTAREIAARAGLALDNARLYAEQRSLAEGLQRSLLTTPPEPDHCEIVVRYVPAARVASVGGDWYDAFLQPDGGTVLVIGDVMGHDTVAAAAMGQLRGLLRGIAWHTGDDPASVLSGLDAAMQGLQVGTTATALVARLEQDAQQLAAGTTTLRWSNAGHPPPLVLGPDGSVGVLGSGDADLLLGFDPATSRSDRTHVLARGSTVLLYTDGLIERRDQDLDDGLALLAGALAELGEQPLSRLCDALLARLLPDEAEDDVALVAVRLHPQDRPRPPEAGPVRVPDVVPPDPAGG